MTATETPAHLAQYDDYFTRIRDYSAQISANIPDGKALEYRMSDNRPSLPFPAAVPTKSAEAHIRNGHKNADAVHEYDTVARDGSKHKVTHIHLGASHYSNVDRADWYYVTPQV